MGKIILSAVIFLCASVYGQNIFSYEEALSLALEDVLSIQDIEVQIEEIEEDLDELMKQLREWGWENWPNASRMFIKRQIKEMEWQILHLELNRDITKTNIEKSLRNALVNVLIANNQTELAEARLKISEENLRRTTVLHQFGMVGTNEMLAAGQNLLQQRIDLDNLQMTAFNHRQALNYILRQPLYQMTKVEFETEPPELPDDLNRFTGLLIPQAPAIRQMQIIVDRRGEDKNDFRELHGNRGYWFRGLWYLENEDLQDEWDALVGVHERAVRERSDAMRTMNASIHAAYNQIIRLNNQKTVALSELERATNELEAVKRQLLLGRVTAFEVENALFRVLSAELSLQNLSYQLWLNGFALINP
jgi:outer membrane protein TolC